MFLPMIMGSRSVVNSFGILSCPAIITYFKLSGYHYLFFVCPFARVFTLAFLAFSFMVIKGLLGLYSRFLFLVCGVGFHFFLVTYSV